MQKEKLIVIVGPTASGKSALAVELARKFSGEIISADSRQVYRGLNVGTGKITKREMRGVPHHLLDVTSPKRPFSASDFVRLASKVHSNTLQNTRMTILVGGTGYYIDSFVGRIVLPDVPPNEKLRAQLEKKSLGQLFDLLKKCDPKRASLMDTPSERGNRRRLIRALEIADGHGSVSTIDLRGRYDVLWIGVRPSMEQLEKNISVRLLARIKQGMITEAKQLHAGGLSYKRMEELGLEYRSLARYLRGKISKQEMVEELKRDICRYSKKQLMYWKRNSDIKWFDPSQKSVIAKLIRAWL